MGAGIHPMPPAPGAPTVEIVQPASSLTLAEGMPLTFSGRVSDDDTNPFQLQIAWESSIDGVLSSSPVDFNGITSGTALLSSGSHVITLRAVDLRGLSNSDSVTVTIGADPNAPDPVILDPLTGIEKIRCFFCSAIGPTA